MDQSRTRRGVSRAKRRDFPSRRRRGHTLIGSASAHQARARSGLRRWTLVGDRACSLSHCDGRGARPLETHAGSSAKALRRRSARAAYRAQPGRPVAGPGFVRLCRLQLCHSPLHPRAKTGNLRRGVFVVRARRRLWQPRTRRLADGADSRALSTKKWGSRRRTRIRQTNCWMSRRNSAGCAKSALPRSIATGNGASWR